MGSETFRTGVSASGMPYATWGRGPRTVLSIPGGPGGAPPQGRLAEQARRQWQPVTDAGFRVWQVCRRRAMPAGHTMADIADDYAGFVMDELGGHADLVHGVSFGGLVAQYLAAGHPAATDRVVLHCSAHRVSAECLAIDRRIADGLERGDGTAVASAFAEYVLPGRRWAWARRMAAPVMKGEVLPADETARRDMLVEIAAEECDTRAHLPDVRVPVLVLAGTKDRCFPPELVRATTEALPDARTVWYSGLGHLRACSAGRFGTDLTDFLTAA